jgi:tetratricopeptide (TPR) repeat protein/serine/threonine protein kinase
MTASASLREPADSADVRLAELIDEFTARLQAGEPLNLDACMREHPEHAERLEKLLPALRLLADASGPGNGRLVPGAVGDIPSPPNLGELGDFRLVREIGRGAMGIVYEAVQISLGRPVALKVMPFAATLDHKQLQRFKNEAQAAAQLHHTNIVPVYFVGCERGVHFYAMQYVEGRNLADVIAELRGQADSARTTPQPSPSPLMECTVDAEAGRAVEPVLPASALQETGAVASPTTARSVRDAAYFRKVTQLGIQAAEALDHAHQHAIVHRDIKPANLLVDATDRLWVTDFGLAQVQCDTRLTMTGDLVGTLRYMSPEQALAKRVVVDHRTDVYSLGATLYELLTLEPAFTGRDRQELLRQIAFEEPRPPRRIHRAIPLELETIVGKAMEKNPADRYATAQELADDLAHFLKDEPIRAKRPTLVLRARKWTRRHTAVVWSAVVCFMLGTAMLAGSIGWAARDRALQQEKAVAAVRTNLDEAWRLHQQGKRREAQAALHGAEMLLASAPSPGELRERCDRLRADLKMLNHLEELYVARRPDVDEQLDRQVAALGYAEAFTTYGLPILNVEPQEAAARIDASAIAKDLLAGLVAWTTFSSNEADRAKLRAVSRLADHDPWRQRLREAASVRDWDGMQRLAEQPEVLDQPAQTIVLIANAFIPRDPAAAAALLRRAHQRHPDNFWINLLLGRALSELKPPRLDEAIGFCRAALALHPQSPVVHINLGVVFFHQGKFAEALEECQEALRINPSSAAAHNNLGSLLEKQKNFVEAEAEFREAIHLKRGDAGAHYNLGMVLVEQNKPAEAEVELRTAIQLEPNSPKAHSRLAEALADQHKFADAEEECQRALRLDANFANAHMMYGRILGQTGRPVQGEQATRKAISLNADDPSYYCGLGVLLFDQSKYREAEAEFRKALGMERKAMYCFNLGNALFEQHQYAEAVVEYNKALRIDPKYADALGSLGNTLYKQGKHREAAALFESVLLINSADPRGLNGRGMILYEQGRFEEALAVFRKALCFKADYVNAQENLANTLRRLDKLPEAEAEYQKAIQLRPKAESYYALGFVLQRQGKKAEALAACRKAIEIQPEHAQAHLGVGFILLEQGEFAEAECEIREAVNYKPDLAEAHLGLGSVLMEQCRFTEALASLRRGHELSSKNSPGDYASASKVSVCERLIELDGKLPAILRGEARAASAAEQLELAFLCTRYKKLHLAATRLYRDAFGTEPTLADDPHTGNRYNAACSAALAGCGRGKDAAGLDDTERARLRGQALDWLRADLTAWGKLLLEDDIAMTRPVVVQQLEHWLKDADLARVRGEALAELPEAEGQRWRDLWADVEKMLAKERVKRKLEEKREKKD